MNKQEILEKLCYHDIKNPKFILHIVDEDEKEDVLMVRSVESLPLTIHNVLKKIINFM